jgi:hypothetical protein
VLEPGVAPTQAQILALDEAVRGSIQGMLTGLRDA